MSEDEAMLGNALKVSSADLEKQVHLAAGIFGLSPLRNLWRWWHLANDVESEDLQFTRGQNHGEEGR